MENGDNFWKRIEEGYGTPEEFAKVLDLAVEMLFHLEEGVFSQREMQSVVEAIRGLVVGLRWKSSLQIRNPNQDNEMLKQVQHDENVISKSAKRLRNLSEGLDCLFERVGAIRVKRQIEISHIRSKWQIYCWLSVVEAENEISHGSFARLRTRFEMTRWFNIKFLIVYWKLVIV